MLRFQKDIITARHCLRVTGNDLKISARQLNAFQELISGIATGDCNQHQPSDDHSQSSNRIVTELTEVGHYSSGTSYIDNTNEVDSTINNQDLIDTKCDNTSSGNLLDMCTDMLRYPPTRLQCNPILSPVVNIQRTDDVPSESDSDDPMTIKSGSNDTIRRILPAPPKESSVELRWSSSSTSLESLLGALTESEDTESPLDDIQKMTSPGHSIIAGSIPTKTTVCTASLGTLSDRSPNITVQQLPKTTLEAPIQTTIRDVISTCDISLSDRVQWDVISPSSANAVTRLLQNPKESPEYEVRNPQGSAIASYQLVRSHSHDNASCTINENYRSTKPETKVNESVRHQVVLRTVDSPLLTECSQISTVSSSNHVTGSRTFVKVRPPVPMRKSSALTPPTNTSRDTTVDHRPKKPPRVSLKTATKTRVGTNC